MLFCTYHYALFLMVVVTLYWSLPPGRGRTWLLVAAGIFFYATWNKWLAALVVGTSLIDFQLAHWLHRATSQGRRRLILGLSIGTNLSLLFYFKYVNFFLSSIEEALALAGQSQAMPVLKLIVPIGISFYTFEVISYMVDVYRQKIQPETRIANFLLFILFFPHLVAGPIVRARDFLPQIARPTRLSHIRFRAGLGLIALGVFKKLLIADRLAEYADPIFAAPGLYETAAHWCATFAFAVQIYCDFSGYSDIAIGSGYLLGYKLTVNFRLPFLAPNPSEFWRRWHISLSSWLRDYIYIPLGGSRCGPGRNAFNLMATMIIGGLWHGANWTYFLWGALQGTLLILHKIFARLMSFAPGANAFWRTTIGTSIRIWWTFLFFALGMVVFRAANLEIAGSIYERLFVLHPGLPHPLALGGLWLTLAVVAIGHVFGASRSKWRFARANAKSYATPGLAAIAGSLSLLLVLAPGSTRAFIYFVF